jgi:hypothetical protein
MHISKILKLIFINNNYLDFVYLYRKYIFRTLIMTVIIIKHNIYLDPIVIIIITEFIILEM